MTEAVIQFVTSPLNMIQTHFRETGRVEAQARGLSVPSEVDAFTHAWTSAHLTLWFGPNTARVLGDYNEVRNVQANPSDSNMDLWNNRAGRDIGIDYNLNP